MTTEILVPELGESVLEATVHQWLKSEGDRVEVGEAVVELETDKVNLEVGAERSGVLKRILRQAGEDVAVGDALGVIEKGEADESDRADRSDETGDAGVESPEERDTSEDGKPSRQSDPAKPEEKITATPIAERIAKDRDVDLQKVAGSGPGGRVTKEDVQRYLEEQSAARKEMKAPDSPTSPRAETEHPGVERVKMSRRRRTIAQHLVAVQQSAAMLTTFNEVDMGAIMDLRKRRNPAFEERHGIKLGITSFFIRAAIAALKDFPRLNAEVDGDEILFKSFYDIGVAIGDEEGLIVPVIRGADRLSFAEIEKKIDSLVRAVRAKSLAIEDLRGGTFSITNGGVFGSLLSTPILNPPQVGILGLHKIEPRPVAINKEIEIRQMMYVALSYDHRIVDGREAVQFLVRIKELVEDPEHMLLEG